MHYIIPHYYRQFRCLGSSCPDTCCAGWEIGIDPSSLRKYRKMRGTLGARLHNEINWEKECFRNYNGRCAFLNEDNLCDLYLEGGGRDAFCRTCRTYPRHIEEFEGLREISLSLSCPEAARLILEQTEPVQFLHTERPGQEKPYESFDFFLFTKLEDARDLMMKILQNREHPFRLRAAIVLALAHDLQQRIDGHGLADADRLLTRYDSPGIWDWFEGKISRTGSGGPVIERLFIMLDLMEPLRPDWKPFLRKVRTTLKESPEPADTPSGFKDVFTDLISEQLMVYFNFTYFCGAVYNDNAFGKARLCLVSVILIREMVRALWLEDPKSVTRDTIVTAAYRYAREIEHSDHNKYKMEQLLDDEERFSTDQLISAI